MTDRTCEKCQKKFSIPAKLRRHRLRKTPCAPVVEQAAIVPVDAPVGTKPKVACPHCNRLYASHPSMRHHLLHKCKAAPTQNTIARLHKQVTELQAQMADMKVSLDEVRAQLANN